MQLKLPVKDLYQSYSIPPLLKELSPLALNEQGRVLKDHNANMWMLAEAQTPITHNQSALLT